MIHPNRSFLRLAPSTLAVFATLALAAPIRPAHATDWDPAKLTTPALRPIQKIQPLRKTLKNGIVVYLLEDHTLPVVKGSAYVKATPAWIPADKLGLGSITGEVMRSGGTDAHPGDQLDDHLGAIGAHISTGYDGRELATTGFRSLSENATEVIQLLAPPLKERMNAPVPASQSFAVVSDDPVSTFVPSGEYATEPTTFA